jgi:hypothetical protein
MQVICPRGTQCPGSPRNNICYLSKKQKYVPSFIMRKIKSSTSTGERLAVAGLVLLMMYLARGGEVEEDRTMFEIYQCPTCGAHVYFMESYNSEGRVYERLGDDWNM